MATIRQLPENVIGKIAAGEVIERPASVVKELVENSLDASALHVYVEIAAGGRQLIRVADDGAGMGKDDVELSVQRHATSKMASPTDLFAISTLGFRGEALASIAAVSRLSLETRREGEEAGTRIEVEGGVQTALVAAARDVGTTVTARSLFFNTPARRKFLRHVDTEARYTVQAVTQLATAYPAISFQLNHNDRQSLDLHGSDRRTRAGQVIGMDPDELLTARLGDGALEIEVFVGSPSSCRRTRSRQYCIVRNRPVHHGGLNRAVYDGFGSLLPHSSHPVFVLWLDVDPRTLDVNVHPTKREVKFAAEREIQNVIQGVVRQALDVPEAKSFSGREAASVDLDPSLDGHGAVAEEAVAFQPSMDREWPGADEAGVLHEEPTADQLDLRLLPSASLGGGSVLNETTAAEEITPLTTAANSGALWQIHNKYIVATTRDGMVFVDQHVAHERIRYEEVLEDLEREEVAAQQLLLPLNLEVSPVEMEVFRQSQSLFNSLGFGAREFGPSSVLVDSVPAKLRNWGDGAVFQEILGELIEEIQERPNRNEAMAASLACHTSIRAGQRLSQQEMRTLIRRLLQAREPFSCPHGRPIIVKVPLRELDKLFGRA